MYKAIFVLLFILLLTSHIFSQDKEKPTIVIEYQKKELLSNDNTIVHLKITNNSEYFFKWLNYDVNFYDKNGEYLGQNSLMISNFRPNKSKVEKFLISNIPYKEISQWEFDYSHIEITINKVNYNLKESELETVFKK